MTPEPERTQSPGATPREPSAPAGLFPLLIVLIFVAMMDMRVITAVLSQIATDLHTTVTGVGIALTVYQLAYGISQLAYGPLADRMGAMRVVSTAAVLFAVAVLIGAFVPSLDALIGVRLLTGAVAASFFPLTLATVGKLVPPDRRHDAVAALLAAFAGGQVMGSALGGVLAEFVTWRAMFVVDAALVGLLLVPLWRYRGATPPTEDSWSGTAVGRTRLLRDRQALFIYAAVFVEGAAFFGGFSYLGALLHDRYGLSFLKVGLILTLDGLTIILTSRIVAGMGRRIGENALILSGGLLMGAGYVFPVALGTWAAVLPAVTALGVGFTLSHTVFQKRVTELDSITRGTTTSLFAFSLFIGSAAGTAVQGLMLDHAGYDGVLLLSGGTLGLLGILAPRLTSLEGRLQPRRT